MLRKIIQESYDEIINDKKLLNLSFIVYFGYALVFIQQITVNGYALIASSGIIDFDPNTYKDLIMNFLGNDLGGGIIGIASVGIISLVLFYLIGYMLIPPIAEGATISYISKKSNGIGSSIGKGFMNFFSMFEYAGMVKLFQFLPFVILLARIQSLGILMNWFVLTFMIILFFLVIITDILFIYTRFYIVLEDMTAMSAIKKSMATSIENIKITTKFMMLNYFLYIKIILNTLILLGLPLVGIYLLIENGLTNRIINIIITVIILVVSLILVYVISIIKAFFINSWYKIFNQIKK